MLMMHTEGEIMSQSVTAANSHTNVTGQLYTPLVHVAMNDSLTLNYRH